MADEKQAEPRPSLRYTIDALLRECHERLPELNELHEALSTRVKSVEVERQLVTDTIAALAPLLENAPEKTENAPHLSDEVIQKIAEHQIRKQFRV